MLFIFVRNNVGFNNFNLMILFLNNFYIMNFWNELKFLNKVGEFCLSLV